MTTAGPLRSIQAAQIDLPTATLESLWSTEHLERLAGSYWRYLTRVSRGLIKVAYAPDSRTVVLLTRRLPLLRFRVPEYQASDGRGQVTWPIDRGLLVARPGRGQGYLRITIERLPGAAASGESRIMVRSEVANFYPLLRGGGRFARLGARFYSTTQLRVHVRITHGFLRSLANLDLPPSDVGAMSTTPRGG